MSLISNATAIVTTSVARFNRASDKLLRATSGLSNDDPAEAIGEQIEAKAQFSAGLATVRIADDMLKALIEISQETTR